MISLTYNIDFLEAIQNHDTSREKEQLPLTGKKPTKAPHLRYYYTNSNISNMPEEH